MGNPSNNLMRWTKSDLQTFDVNNDALWISCHVADVLAVVHEGECIDAKSGPHAPRWKHFVPLLNSGVVRIKVQVLPVL